VSAPGVPQSEALVVCEIVIGSYEFLDRLGRALAPKGDEMPLPPQAICAAHDEVCRLRQPFSTKARILKSTHHSCFRW